MKRHEMILAGGCFWGTEAYLKLIPGIVDTEVGYANSNMDHPSYEDVCSGETNAAEAVRVTFDEDVISLPLLLEAYYRTIDPTSLNRQGNDRGTQYRTGIYWVSPEDAPTIASSISGLEKRLGEAIHIEFGPLECFFPAEEYHQDYLDSNPFGYCHVNLADAKSFVSEHRADLMIS